MKRLIGIVLLYSWLGFTLQAQASVFPKPDSLQPSIDFWKRVYTEIDRSSGFLHDAKDLSRVYATIDIPDRTSRKKRKGIVKWHKQKLRKLLHRIADKSASELRGEERRIRKLFSKKATAKKIRSAAGKIRFQLGQADKFRSAINKSGVFMRYIRQQFVAAGLPVELSALPYVESSFNIRARSHVGAAGIWQFMPGTGRRFMKINHVIDERYDPYRSTQAAIRLLQYNYDILQSWPLALTAYNHGVAGMRRAIRQTGSHDIGIIVQTYRSRRFGFASRNFYAEFLAALEVSSNPEKYFPSVGSQSPFDYTVFTLDHYVPADALALALGVDVDILRTHNLALREPVWEGEKHLPARYELRVPSKHLADDLSKLLLNIPRSARFSAQIQDKIYRVRRGDSLSRIAALYRVSVKDLVMMNKLRSRHRIRAGQVLFLPRKGVPIKVPEKPVVVASVTPAMIGRSSKPVTSDMQAGLVASVPAAGSEDSVDVADDSHQQLQATDPADYTVTGDNTIEIQAAETLGHYADWLGVRAQQLRRLNRMSYRAQLVIGKRLKLDFSKVSHADFVHVREDYHKGLEDAFFAISQINGTREYRIKRGDSLWTIASKQRNLPMWLIRQYNPDINFSGLKPGDKIVIPVIVKKAITS